jgi:hypothetical protein
MTVELIVSYQKPQVLHGPWAYIPETGDLGTIKARWELIDERVAATFLSSMGKNRQAMETLEYKYSGDMERGLWPVTHQGIAFNVKGDLIDGQHRLKSIIRAKVKMWMLVTYGLSMEAMGAIDRGKMRTAAHALQIMGHAFGSTRAVAVARRLAEGPFIYSNSKRVSEAQLHCFMDDHFDAIKFALDNVNHRHGTAAVAACVGRAYYHYDHDQLRRFCQALADKLPFEEHEERDKNARMLREAIAASRNRNGSTTAQIALYNRTQEAIKDYFDGKAKAMLRGRITTDIFPLPSIPPVNKEYEKASA